MKTKREFPREIAERVKLVPEPDYLGKCDCDNPDPHKCICCGACGCHGKVSKK